VLAPIVPTVTTIAGVHRFVPTRPDRGHGNAELAASTGRLTRRTMLDSVNTRAIAIVALIIAVIVLLILLL
jgi:hypothetical protein